MQSHRQRIDIPCSDAAHGKTSDGDTVGARSTAREATVDSEAAAHDVEQSRAVIEQAKGMLMVLYGVDAEFAFGLLRDQSQHHNVKLRELAAQVSNDLLQMSQVSPLRRRLELDRLVNSAHRRIGEPAGRHADAASVTGT